MIKFEKVKRISDDIRLPKRATSNSAGYDFFALEDCILPAKQFTRVMTGVKCELLPNQMLMLANRSSNPSRKGLILANGIGIVDSDYYENLDNDGEIGFEFYNISDTDVIIRKGERLGQGVILKFDRTEDDYIFSRRERRTGGWGSTGSN